jgi:methyltransferase (TIGR00027 family)
VAAERRASRTAVLVCQGRAAADGRLSPDRFSDPVAISLLREDERVAVDQVRAGTPPRGRGQRLEYEMVRASAEVMAPRTITIDDAVRGGPAPQLVILGAGLDDRAFRLPELAGVDVFEVDQPASQQDKRDRAGDLRPRARSLRFVPVDFARDDLTGTLAAAGHRPELPTTWLWEGVVPYLTRVQVATTVAAVDRASAVDSRLIVNYQSPALAAAAGRVVARAMTAFAGQPAVWASEPRRSSWRPAALRALLAGHRFAVGRDDDLLILASRLETPVRQRRSLRSGRVAVADRGPSVANP